MNDIEEARLKKTIENLLETMKGLEKGQRLLTGAVVEVGKRLDALEKTKNLKPKLIGLNGKEITAQ